MKKEELIQIIDRLKKKLKKLENEKNNAHKKHIEAQKIAIDLLKWMPPIKFKKKKYKTRKATK